MDLEKFLQRGIPLSEAADFFIRVRGGDKTANAPPMGVSSSTMGATPVSSPASLPPASRGQSMQQKPPMPLPPTAMGQNTAPGMKMAADGKSPEEVGKERAHASLSAEFEKEKAHKSEKHLGHLGSAVGALGGGLATHHYGKGNPVATVMGAALGHHLGKGVGRDVGAGHDAHRHEKAAAAFKLALEQVGIQPQLDPATQQYIAMEQAAQEQAGISEAEYLHQQLNQARTEQQQLSEQAQAAQQQAEVLQQQQAMHDQQTQQQQAAVAAATQQAMTAQDQVLQEQQTAAAMRMAFQHLRGTLLEAASAEPPSLTPTPGTQQAEQTASQAAAPNSAPEPTAGPAGQAPAPGTAPNSPAPTGDETVSAPAASQQGPVGETSAAGTVGQKAQQDGAQIPNKEVLSHVKMAALRDVFMQHAKSLGAVLPHAAVGGAIGAGLGAAEAHSSNDALRSKVEGLEGKQDRGLGDTVNLAQSKARLTLGDFAKQHPVATTGMSALTGALTGATAGPALVSSLKRQKEDLGAIGKNLKSLAGAE